MARIKLRVTRNTAKPLVQEMIARLKDPWTVLQEPVVNQIYATFAGIWAQAGAYSGLTPWEPLSEHTLRRKRGKSAQILVEDGTLRASLTQPGAAYGYVELVDPRTLAVGTKVPYAPYHQLGTKHMPKRQIAPDDWPAEDTARLTELFADYILTGKVNA